MAIIKPFRALRPAPEFAAQVAALPYDVYNREEACQAVQGKPLSFLNIDRAETQFSAQMDMYADCVYEKARELLEARIADGTFLQDTASCYYVYQLTRNRKSQTGIAACCSVDDYLNQVIKKHENTRFEKELDRIRHVDVTSAHTGPIFQTYRPVKELDDILTRVCTGIPVYDFTAEDGISHKLWKIDAPDLVSRIETIFSRISSTYIADGHHRAASAVHVALKRREEHPDYTGEEDFNYFLSILFPADQLTILPYNRAVSDLNQLTEDAFLNRISENFTVTPLGTLPFAPEHKGEFGMLLGDSWYRLEAKAHILSTNPIKGLDVSILQDALLEPILGIADPCTDSRIDFIGGIRGLTELERRAASDAKAAFSMYPTSIQELLNVADAGLLMPPKSTWFEPKLRSGLLIHLF